MPRGYRRKRLRKRTTHAGLASIHACNDGLGGTVTPPMKSTDCSRGILGSGKASRDSFVTNNSTLHAAIISFFLKHQRPPTVSEIASQFRCSEAEARSASRALADYHGAVLHPHSDEIGVAHLFPSAPTTCVVRSGQSSGGFSRSARRCRPVCTVAASR